MAKVALAGAVATFAMVVALLAGLVSRVAWRPGGEVAVPWGLLLGTVGSASVVVLARAAGRGIGLVAAVGWIVGLALLMWGGPHGDFAIANDVWGLSFLLVATTAVIAAASWGVTDR
ncbi:MAG: hypothetical protein H0U28_10650 [Nocardioidaceae bacterium]|nr:hypothetical protein [Nocardioidaceae bacterium]